MRKIFLSLVLALASVTMFAEEITSVSLTVIFPKAGDEIEYGKTYVPGTDNLALITLPDDANYTCDMYDFFIADESDWFGGTLVENMEYALRLTIFTKSGYEFADSGLVIKVNGADPEILNEEPDRRDFVINFIAAAPTALDNTAADSKATKRIANGQLLIEKNGNTYNAIGEEIR